jgi:hypothetical protein
MLQVQNDESGAGLPVVGAERPKVSQIERAVLFEDDRGRRPAT